MEQCCEEDPKNRPNFNRCLEVTKNHLRRCNDAVRLTSSKHSHFIDAKTS